MTLLSKMLALAEKWEREARSAYMTDRVVIRCCANELREALSQVSADETEQT